MVHSRVGIFAIKKLQSELFHFTFYRTRINLNPQFRGVSDIFEQKKKKTYFRQNRLLHIRNFSRTLTRELKKKTFFQRVNIKIIYIPLLVSFRLVYKFSAVAKVGKIYL